MRLQIQLARALSEPVVLLSSASNPIAVLSAPVVRLKSASLPSRCSGLDSLRPVLGHRSRCGESAKQARVSAVNKASWRGTGFIECLNGRVVVFIDELYEITLRVWSPENWQFSQRLIPTGEQSGLRTRRKAFHRPRGTIS